MYRVGDTFDINMLMSGGPCIRRCTIIEFINGRVRLSVSYPPWMEIWLPEFALDQVVDQFTYMSIQPPPQVPLYHVTPRVTAPYPPPEELVEEETTTDSQAEDDPYEDTRGW